VAQVIVRLPDVKARTGLSRSSIYNKINEGTFPRPVRLGLRACGWLESEIEAWIDESVKRSRAAIVPNREQAGGTISLPDSKPSIVPAPTGRKNVNSELAAQSRPDAESPLAGKLEPDRITPTRVYRRVNCSKAR
jgi:prophage regulatory protein